MITELKTRLRAMKQNAGGIGAQRCDIALREKIQYLGNHTKQHLWQNQHTKCFNLKKKTKPDNNQFLSRLSTGGLMSCVHSVFCW